MPSLVNQILLSELEQAFENMGSCVVLDVGAVQPDQDIELRGKLREAGVQYRVVRSRLATKAFAKMGLDMSVAMKSSRPSLFTSPVSEPIEYQGVCGSTSRVTSTKVPSPRLW